MLARRFMRTSLTVATLVAAATLTGCGGDGAVVRAGQVVSGSPKPSPTTLAEPSSSASSSSSATDAPTTGPPSQPVPTTPTEASESSAPPSLASAPVLVAVHGSEGSLTLTFDQPVDPVAPNPTQPPSAGSEGLNTMYLTVFGADSACSVPQGNAHYFISGIGTATVTVEASSIVAPTTYIRIAPGFVRSVADGTYNQAVGCTAVAISGA
jgi:hypothetical protein